MHFRPLVSLAFVCLAGVSAVPTPSTVESTISIHGHQSETDTQHLGTSLRISTLPAPDYYGAAVCSGPCRFDATMSKCICHPQHNYRMIKNAVLNDLRAHYYIPEMDGRPKMSDGEAQVFLEQFRAL
ncbi:hypothetical protein C8R44DRAFT_812230 [Mycena epipterygia]|nr:hypothetical protein C8R44DRAFT_812230 [Mycena epipterygia]